MKMLNCLILVMQSSYINQVIPVRNVTLSYLDDTKLKQKYQNVSSRPHGISCYSFRFVTLTIAHACSTSTHVDLYERTYTQLYGYILLHICALAHNRQLVCMCRVLAVVEVGCHSICTARWRTLLSACTHACLGCQTGSKYLVYYVMHGFAGGLAGKRVSELRCLEM